jgi:hypothetical protein
MRLEDVEFYVISRLKRIPKEEPAFPVVRIIICELHFRDVSLITISILVCLFRGRLELLSYLSLGFDP